jgi:hypothetical protein
MPPSESTRSGRARPDPLAEARNAEELVELVRAPQRNACTEAQRIRAGEVAPRDLPRPVPAGTRAAFSGGKGAPMYPALIGGGAASAFLALLFMLFWLTVARAPERVR